MTRRWTKTSGRSGKNLKIQGEKLINQLARHNNNRADSIDKLSSGSVFTARDPRPSERSLADGLESKLRSLAASKRNVNDAVSLLQTAESSMSEIGNMITRMKEINIAAASTTMSGRERQYLFVEYQALHDEISRVAQTTSYNGIPLLDGNQDGTPEELVLRFGDPTSLAGGAIDDLDDDLNIVRLEGLRDFSASATGLGLQSAQELLHDALEGDRGLDIEDVQALLRPQDDDLHATVYDEALEKIAMRRAVFGSLQERMNRALDFADVYQENINAAKSRIADTDYAKEVVKLAQESILSQAATGLLAQNNLEGSMTLNLLSTLRS